MDDIRKSASGSSAPQPPPSGNAQIDLGSTPPWTLPPMYYQESAMRSTQASPQQTDTFDYSLLGGNATMSTNLASWSALNHPRKQVAAPQGNEDTAEPPLINLEPRIVSAEEDVSAAHDDSDDKYDDGVYMIEAGEGSWSGPLQSDDDPQVRAALVPQAEVALKHLKRAQKLAEQQQRERLASIAAEAGQLDDQTLGLTAKDKEKWRKDLLLRNVTRQIKQQLKDGAVLTLERLGPVQLTMTCAHPLCPAPDVRIPAGAYYVVLGHPRHLEDASRYCLYCLEGLWNGEGMAGPLPNSRTDEREKKSHQVPIFSLDGAMDDLRLTAAGISPTPRTPASTNPTPSAASRPTSSRNASTPGTSYSGSDTSSPSLSHDPAKNITARPDSPLTRKSAGLISSTYKKHETIHGAHGKHNKVAKRTSTKSTQRNADAASYVRRSTRLQDTAAPNPVTRSTTAAALKKTTPRITQSGAADAIGDEVCKAESRLQVMYEEREKALVSLEPGDRITIKHPRNRTVRRSLSKDLFDVTYTDLLADPVKYWKKLPPREFEKESEKDDETTVGPMPEKLLSSPCFVENAAVRYWCFCRKPEGSRRMIECASQKCLVGWYHMQCVSAYDVLDTYAMCSLDSTYADLSPVTDWLCELCRPTMYSGKLPPGSQLERTIDQLFSLTYAQEGQQRRRNTSAPMQQGHDNVSAEHDINLPQLDGGADYHTLPHQPLRPSPLSQSMTQIPASLLASKHAPTGDELSFFSQSYITDPDEEELITLPETPGSPVSSLSSTTSSGRWRAPPTRFQHLASFVRVGNSLNGIERAAVDLWKAVSKEQLHWEGFLHDREQLREHNAVLLNMSDDEEDCVEVNLMPREQNGHGEEQTLENGETLGKSIGPATVATHSEVGDSPGTAQRIKLPEEEEVDVEQELMSESGLLKKQCYGSNLTTVLAEVRFRELGRAAPS